MAWLLRHPTLLLLASLALVAGGLGGLVAWYAIRPRRITVPDVLPEGFPAEGFSHASFEALLTRFVGARGEVDYAAWVADPQATAALDAYLAAVARYSPSNAPARFPSESDRLAYWMYAYNACVLKGVLLHWPLKSVKDVKAPLDLVSGLGFFGRLWFTLGGEPMSLHQLENGVIRERFPDPRIHFVLNCGSEGCPVLRPELPTGEALEPFLAKAAAEFVASDANLRLDPETKTLHLSQIFEWYRSDFTGELARRGLPPGEQTLSAYVRLVASGERKAELEAAKDYAEAFIPYGWDVNGK